MVSTKLKKLWRQAKLDYDSCLQATELGNKKEAVERQLLAIDSLNKFNDQLLVELDRIGTKPNKIWAP